MPVQYLSPMLAAVLLGLLGLRWLRLGGLLYLLVGGSCGGWFLFGRTGSLSGAASLLNGLLAS